MLLKQTFKLFKAIVAKIYAQCWFAEVICVVQIANIHCSHIISAHSDSYGTGKILTRKMKQAKFSYSEFEKVGRGVTQSSQWKLEKMKLIIMIIN